MICETEKMRLQYMRPGFLMMIIISLILVINFSQPINSEKTMLDEPILHIYVSLHCGHCIKLLSNLLSMSGVTNINLQSSNLPQYFDIISIRLKSSLSDKMGPVNIMFHQCGDGAPPCEVKYVPLIRLVFKVNDRYESKDYSGTIFDSLDNGVNTIAANYKATMEASNFEKSNTNWIVST